MPKPFKVLDRRIVLQTPIFDVREEKSVHPKTGEVGHYYVLENPEWVNAIALTREGELILVRQWRHGVASVELELPAGLVDEGEDPVEAGLRELKEETGYEADQSVVLGKVVPNQAYQSNHCTTILLLGCHLTGPVDLDPGEDIETVLVRPDEIPDLIASGELRNAMTICAMFWWLEHARGLDWGAITPRK